MAAAIRHVVRNDCIQGTIEEWSGNCGWVKIDLNAQDFEGNAALLRNGAKVNVICDADGNGLGAQQCNVTSTAPQKQQLHLAKPKLLPKSKMVAKPAAKVAAKQGGVIKTIQKTYTTTARRYIVPNFITGKVEIWLGHCGWIKADKPIKDAAAEKSKGRIYCCLADIVPGNALKTGANVLFKAYVAGVIPRAALVQLAQGGVAQVPNKPGSTTPAKLTEACKYVCATPVVGTVDEWRGKFGWLKPKRPIHHPLASKHEGKIYCSIENVEGKKELPKGATVTFKVFANHEALTADTVKRTKGQNTPGQTATGKPGEAREYAFFGIHGVVDSWSGEFGWIKTPKPLKHADAGKNHGRIFCSAENVQDGQFLQKGDRVVFKVFVNEQGLRADAVKKITNPETFKSTMPAGPLPPPIKGSAAMAGVKKTIQKHGHGSGPKPPSGP